MSIETPIIKRVKNALMSIQRRSWEQGECMQALLELRDYDAMIVFAREASYIRLDDGRTTLTTEWEKGTVTDTCACGEALMLAAKLTDDQLITETYEALLDYTLHHAKRNPDGVLYHLTGAPEFWVDSIYMMPPFLAAAGYYEEAVKQINGYWDALYNPETKMLDWIWDDEKKVLIRKHHRSICTGYAALGIVKVASRLPEKMRHQRDDLMEKGRIVIDSILKFIDAGGVCHDTLDDPSSPIGINAVSMVACAIYRAMAAGYLNEYAQSAETLRASLHAKVDPYGFLFGVCGVPDNNRTGISANGQSFFLQMEAAYYDYEAARPDAWYNRTLQEKAGAVSRYMGVIAE